MGEFSNRLKMLIKPGERRYQFAKRLDVSPTQISRYLKKGILPKQGTVLNICLKTGASPRWLLTGQGPKFGPPLLDPTDYQAAATGTTPSSYIIEESEPSATRLGLSASRSLTDRDRAGLAASHLLDTSIPKPEREALADLVRDAMDEPGLREQIIEFYRFLKFKGEKK